MSGVGDTLIIGSAAVTIVLAVTGTLGFLGRKAWRAIRRLTLFLDDYEGTPARAGVSARPGVMERLQSQDALLASLVADVAEMKAELPKNGVPLAVKIDALWTRHLAEQAAAAAAAAAARPVIVPLIAPTPPAARPDPPVGE